MNTKTVVLLFSFVFVAIQCKNISQHHSGLQNIDIAEARQMIKQDKSTIIIDVRTPEEIAEGKISNALEIDYFGDKFDARLSELARDKVYLVYCRSGNRSSKTANKMKDLGFEHVYNMKGGFNAWKTE